MCKYLFLLLVFVFQTVFAAESTTPYLTSENDTLSIGGVDQVIEQALRDFDIPGVAIGVIANGEIILSKGYGVRDYFTQLPVTDETLFAIGSCTKAFTTFALGTMVDEGLIEWDMPVIHYLPEFMLWDPYTTQHITVRDLVTHRAGLPRHDLVWYNSRASREELINRLQYLEPICDFREKTHYNNLMYMVSGYLAEKVTGLSWEEIVRSRIFSPLGMFSSNFSVFDSQKTENFSLPHSQLDGIVYDIPFRNISNIGPAGSINSTVKDMLNWVNLQLSDGMGLIKSTTLREMQTSQVVMSDYSCYPMDKEESFFNYGMGWVIRNYRGFYHVMHNGGVDGFIARVSLLPQENIGVVLLTNRDGLASALLTDSLTKVIFDSVLGLQSKPRVEKALDVYRESQKIKPCGGLEEQRAEDTKPSHELKEYLGVYEHPGYGKIRVQLLDGKLNILYHSISWDLLHWQNDTFSGEKKQDFYPVFEGVKFTFHTDDAGRVNSLSVPLETKVNDIEFNRVEDDVLNSPKFLRKCVGTYNSFGFSTIEIVIEEDHLSCSFSFLGSPRELMYDLEYEQGLNFRIKGIPDASIRFVIDGGDAVKELRYIQDGRESIYSHFSRISDEYL